MDDYTEARVLTMRDWALRALALALWLLTAYLAVLIVSAMSDIGLWLVANLTARFDPTISSVALQGAALTVSNCLTIIAGMGLLVVLVISGEWHLKYVATRVSWRVLGITLAIQAAILLFHALIAI